MRVMPGRSPPSELGRLQSGRRFAGCGRILRAWLSIWGWTLSRAGGAGSRGALESGWSAVKIHHPGVSRNCRNAPRGAPGQLPER